ncbi:hypothetical protein [Kordia zhangzhouensis]|uniref:hypothetical protein n=1 Tax=Kordia zhangzhouensis TaxID=1620405 RepID=UPI0006296359|nr:hypothetical protein [Kordia zhangzhouensis]
MKKRTLKKLRLKKSAIAKFSTKALTGGNGQSDFDVYCISVNFCETKDFSRCFGEAECQIYQPHTER